MAWVIVSFVEVIASMFVILVVSALAAVLYGWANGEIEFYRWGYRFTVMGDK